MIYLLADMIFLPILGYVGPGAGLTAIGAFLAILVGLIVAIFGFVWYPVKTLIRRRSRSHLIQREEPIE